MYPCKSLRTIILCSLLLLCSPHWPLSASAATSTIFTQGEVGTWLWHANLIETQPETILNFLQRQKVKSLYLQVNRDLNIASYQKFIAQCTEKGIKVYALDGSADWVSSQGQIHQQSFFQWVDQYQNQSSKNQQFVGIHLDVEPYLNDQWKTNRAQVIQRYQQVILNGKAFADRMNLRFALDIPFWLEQIPFNNQFGQGILGEWVIKNGDIVAIMAYRNQAKQIINFVKEEMNWAQQYNTTVTIAVETGVSNEGDFITFYGKGQTYMNNQLNQVYQTYGTSPAYGGVAIHHVMSWMAMQ